MSTSTTTDVSTTVAAVRQGASFGVNTVHMLLVTDDLRPKHCSTCGSSFGHSGEGGRDGTELVANFYLVVIWIGWQSRLLDRPEKHKQALQAT